MKLVTLAFKSIANRKASVLLTLFTIAISVMLLLSIERVRQEAKQSFSSTISGTDLIVGARTGDIQLLLSSVFRIGHANNGLSWQSYEYIKAQRGVAWTIPISLGDSHKGFSVLGSDDNYFKYYRYGKKQSLAFTNGRAYHNAQEVVIGSEVAKQLHYHIGQQIVVAHGMGNTSFHNHDDNPLTIVGILEPTGTPVDKTLHVPLKAIEQMHSTSHRSTTHVVGRKNENHAHHDEHEHHHDHSEHNHGALDSEPGDLIGQPKQLTAFLMGFDSPLYTLQVRRNINTYKPEALSAIMPGVTLRELWGMLDIVEKILMLFSAVVVLISLLGMLTTLLSSLSQRRRELAILRSVGARPKHVFALMCSEAVLITALGSIIGVAMFYIVMFIGKGVLQAQFGIAISLSLLSDYELMLLGVIMVSGTAIGAIPAIRAYFYSLNDGMSVKV
ncbi:peptide ABC transporter permease [Pseudoalteromonas luteoviolacea]|uniref:Peptide ABC transporter permease n=1 Tax=Pseudoalteromonas luteoviolacea TaxID=43657 RepID=A0A1C0TP74_9GAMM|nr:ABC transporter permease [Pseudoalteromonas luteoviolacea]OCQ20732.1 peptide ABC transporter permease [Pseudoalteromonas luteoviolacea]